MNIVLFTCNARHCHPSLALRCLAASLPPGSDCQLIEAWIKDRPSDLAERILAAKPSILACSLAIWNRSILAEVLALIRCLAPQLPIILGGPELGEDDEAPECFASVLVSGEGEAVFPGIVQGLLAGKSLPHRITGKAAPQPILPDAWYSETDLRQRVVHLETSRGCPYRCSFCQSASEALRRFPLPEILAMFSRLIDRGARQLSLIDRSFNSGDQHACSILDHLLARWQTGMSLHLELIPDRLSPALRQRISAFPPASLRLEVGLQSLSQAVLDGIDRHCDLPSALANLSWLNQQPSVALHVDLIAGLPGETLNSFANSFNRLWHLAPQEIQLGLLKRLRHSPLARQNHGLIFSPQPPYRILRSPGFSFAQLQNLERLGHLIDTYHNDGRFTAGLQLLAGNKPLANWLAFTHHLHQTLKRVHAIALPRRYELLADYLITQGHPRQQIENTLAKDFLKTANARAQGFPASLRPALERICHPSPDFVL